MWDKHAPQLAAAAAAVCSSMQTPRTDFEQEEWQVDMTPPSKCSQQITCEQGGAPLRRHILSPHLPLHRDPVQGMQMIRVLEQPGLLAATTQVQR